MPVEGWPKGTGDLSLEEWQRDVEETGGDRHSIIVAPGVGSIWETWLACLTTSGWEASNGAKFDLNSNAVRPAGWTSGDAAGLPMFPALVRYDECERGMVEHALRLVVAQTRREYIYPANHYASTIPATSTNHPAMGQRFRLKASFVIPDDWTTEEKAVLRALKKYGAIVADNGHFFSVSICPDDRFAESAFDHLATIDVDNFEVVTTTGPEEGPRSPGAPTVDAGPDQFADLGTTVSLHGTVDALAGATVQWNSYSGPSEAVFTNAASVETEVTFPQTGSYVLELSADDGVHAIAYDAVAVFVAGNERLSNISTRAAIGTGEEVSIGGFIIRGDAPQNVLIRALGPSLTGLGVAGALADPTLELYDGSGEQIATNDNWKEVQEQIIAETGLAPNDAHEAAIWASLMPGNYTAVVAGREESSGVALTEVYELQQSGARLANLSTRGFVGGIDWVMIGGVIITGADPATVVLRGLGPSLAPFGVQEPLANPSPLATNDDWKTTQQAELEATTLAPPNDREPAILTSLPPGFYTAILRGLDGGTEIALLEVYNF
ncbi:MAG TPA: hypothetical protein VH207_14205 [Chthoniobacterales bacterium]|nr:hypothetical protein [Chthoniobacterales bacterium]